MEVRNPGTLPGTQSSAGQTRLTENQILAIKDFKGLIPVINSSNFPVNISTVSYLLTLFIKNKVNPTHIKADRAAHVEPVIRIIRSLKITEKDQATLTDLLNHINRLNFSLLNINNPKQALLKVITAVINSSQAPANTGAAKNIITGASHSGGVYDPVASFITSVTHAVCENQEKCLNEKFIDSVKAIIKNQAITPEKKQDYIKLLITELVARLTAINVDFNPKVTQFLLKIYPGLHNHLVNLGVIQEAVI